MYKVNFLPSDLQDNVSIVPDKLLRITAFVTVIFLLLIPYGTFLYTYQNTKKEIAGIEYQLKTIQSEVAMIESIKNQRLNNQNTLHELQNILDRRLAWSGMLVDVNAVIPVDLWIKTLDLSFTGESSQGGQQAEQPQHGQVQGGAPSVAGNAPASGQTEPVPTAVAPFPNTLTLECYARTVPSAGVFIDKMNGMALLHDVRLNEMYEEKPALKNFTITAKIKETVR